MKTYGVGVIGCGYWGPNLVRNFSRNPRTQVLAVCDSRHERAAKVGAERVFLQVLDIDDLDHLDVLSSVLPLLADSA